LVVIWVSRIIPTRPGIDKEKETPKEVITHISDESLTILSTAEIRQPVTGQDESMHKESSEKETDVVTEKKKLFAVRTGEGQVTRKQSPRAVEATSKKKNGTITAKER